MLLSDDTDPIPPDCMPKSALNLDIKCPSGRLVTCSVD